MQVHRTLDSLRAARLRRPVCTIGVFDGVHRGHRHLLRALRDWADELAGGEPVVITFDPHPQAALGRRPPALLTTLQFRLLLLERQGVAATLVLPFNRELAGWSAARFARDVLRGAAGSRHLLLGFDSAFGRGREGTAAYLRSRPELGIEVRSVGARRIDGAPISSSQVRGAILKGRLDLAGTLLGRSFALYGAVVAGDGRGRALGFPTANLDLARTVIPPRGVYIAEARLEGRLRPALVNIGLRPTFTAPAGGGSSREHVEVHIAGWDSDLYGLFLEVVLHRRLRDERRFSSSEELAGQIRRDLGALERWSAERARSSPSPAAP